MGEIPKSIKRIGGEVKEKLFGKKFEEKAKEAIPPEKRKEMEERAKSERNAIIKEVAALLEEERKTATDEKWLKEVIKSEKKFLDGKLGDKKVIGTVKHILLQKERSLFDSHSAELKEVEMQEDKIRSRAKVDMNWDRASSELQEKVIKPYARIVREKEEAMEKTWRLIQGLETTKVSKKEIAEVLGKKEGKTEQVEK